MQEALPYKAWQTAPTNLPGPSQPLNLNPSPATSSNPTVLKRRESLKSIIDENALVVFGRRGCCMSHVVRRLLLGLGVNPTLYDVDDQDEPHVIHELRNTGEAQGGRDVSFPAVFIGGKWFGGLDRLIAAHISGELTPVLREARALWL